MGEKMTLLYAWVERLYKCRVRGGFCFSKKFLVDYDPKEKLLKVSRNDSYIHEFFGKNIEDITVLVGENGAGKTTFCKDMLWILKEEERRQGSYVMVFSDHEGVHVCCGDNIDKLVIDGECFEYDGGSYTSPKEYKVTVYGIEGGIRFPVIPLLITNAFLPSDLEKSYDEEGDRRYYRSPAYMIQNARKWNQNDYGSAWGGYLHNNSHTYALERTKDPLLEYQVYQNKLMIEGFFAAEAIDLMKKFDFYKEFVMGVRPFEPGSKAADLCAAMKAALKKLNETRRGILDNCYLCLLEEAYLYCGLSRGDEQGHNDIGRLIIDQIEKWKKGSYPAGMTDHSFNKTLLQMIRQQVDKAKKEKPAGIGKAADEWEWYKQLERVLEQLDIWKKDKEKQKLFQYEIGRYRFDSDEGRELLKFYRERLEEDVPFWRRAIGFNLKSGSTGEMAMMNLFAYIMDLVSLWKKTPDKKKWNEKDPEGDEVVFLMIDEIDANLHPKWQQEVVSCIIDFLDQQFKTCKFQLLITSHSPICLSDIPSERVLRLERHDDFIEVSSCPEKTFGANIYDLFYDGFFMKEGTIGTFAQKKIDEAVREIVDNNGRNISNETKYIADSIGEPLVRDQLEEILSRKSR